MSVLVKVCGLTHADDVRAAVESGADALGFVFAASKRRVTAELAADISRDIPDGVLRVAVMLHPSRVEWQVVADVFRPDVLQTDAGDFAALEVAADIESWPVYRQGAGAVAADDTYVYEGAKSGTGTTVDWDQAATMARSGNMILAGGLGPDNVAEAIERVRPFGVDASSSLERAPGRKDADRIAAYVSAAKRDQLRG